MFDAGNLGKTQRDIIRNYNEQDAPTNFSFISELTPERGTVNETSNNDRRKKVTLWPKIIAFIIGVAVLIGALVALIWFFKEDSKGGRAIGTVLEEPEKIPVCPDVELSLGDLIEFTCNVKTKVTAEFITSIPIQDDEAAFNCIKNEDKNSTTCTLNGKVSCSTKSKIRATIYDDDDKAKDTETLQLTILEPIPEARIEPEYDDKNGTVKQFHLTCEHERTCNSYRMAFYVGDHSITENMSCSESYHVSRGYTSKCEATVSGDVVSSYGNGSRINCRLYSGDRLEVSEELVIPKCSDYDKSDTACKYGSNLFSCENTAGSNKSIFCDDECDLVNTCFWSRHVILSDKGSCDSKQCALKWCRYESTLTINNSGIIPYESLCLQ